MIDSLKGKFKNLAAATGIVVAGAFGGAASANDIGNIDATTSASTSATKASPDDFIQHRARKAAYSGDVLPVAFYVPANYLKGSGKSAEEIAATKAVDIEATKNSFIEHFDTTHYIDLEFFVDEEFKGNAPMIMYFVKGESFGPWSINEAAMNASKVADQHRAQHLYSSNQEKVSALIASHE